MKLVVLDGNSIANRAYYGVRQLNAPDGTPTNAVFGFLAILFKLLEEEKPDGLAVTFDVHAPTFRKQKYDAYKAQRKPMPEDLVIQMPILHEVMEAMNIPHYELAGYEADDLMGTISRIANEKGWEAVLVTGDKDSFQLIGGGTVVRHVKSRMGQSETILYDEERFKEEYGFGPKGIIELKALMGDASDNIPGVAGVGEKTALDLIRRYGSVERIYHDLNSLEIRDSLRKKLEDGREMAALSHELVVIDREVPLAFSPEETRIRPVNNDRLYELFYALGLRRYIERLGLKAPAQGLQKQEHVPSLSFESKELTGEAEIPAVVNEARKTGAVMAFSEDCRSFAAAIGERIYSLALDESPLAEKLLRALLKGDVKKTGHNIKDVIRRLNKAGCPSDGWVMDTALAAYLLDPLAKDYSLGRLAEECLDVQREEEQQLGLFADGTELQKDAEALARLAPVLRHEVEKQGMARVLDEIEIPLCPVLAEMEETGFYLDGDALRAFGNELQSQEQELEEKIYALAGGPFNINSPKQLGEVLFDRLGLPAPKKTKTGYSTNVDVLEKLREKHPLPGLVLEYRELSKLTGTYVEGLLKVRDPDGRVRTSFQMTVTATGRLSSADPNLQNIPVRKALGGEIRKMFTAGEGMVLVDADYSQIELRLLAAISGDEVMQQAFLHGEDIHRVTAAQVLGISPEEVTPQQRSAAKAVNFGIVYGISAFSLSQDIGVPVGEAQRYIDSYLGRYPGVADYMNRVVKEAEQQGYVTTLYGRRRNMPEIRSANRNVRSFGERVARNAPIQGTAADIMKLAMIAVWRRMKKEGLKARLIMQVHDELIVECPPEEKDTVAGILTEEMKGVAKLPVPLTAEAGFGRTWYDAK